MVSCKLVGMIKPASSRSSVSLPISSRPVPSWSSGTRKPDLEARLELRRMPSLPSATANCLTRSPVADTIFFRFFQVSFRASLYYFRDVQSHAQFQQLDQTVRVCEKYHPGRRNSPLIKHLGFINLHLEIEPQLFALSTQEDLEDREQGWCAAS
jgi:hypothetical protein